MEEPSTASETDVASKGSDELAMPLNSGQVKLTSYFKSESHLGYVRMRNAEEVGRAAGVAA